MSKAVVFAITFLCLFVVTLVVPFLPPGDMISGFLGITGLPSILGISGATFVSSIINGLIWGIIILVIYALASRPTKKRPFAPMRTPTYPTAPPPTTAPVTASLSTSGKSRERKSPTPAKKRKTDIALNQDIETIEGIGPTYGNKLRNSGVSVIDDLLRTGSTRRKRRILANKVGVAPGTLLKWVYRADFFRVKGIGTQYSSLLESAGVNTVARLSRRNPKNLYAKLMEINRKKNLVRRIPPYRTIQRWIKSAKKLKHVIED